jgi:hypothetical protein
VRHCVSASPFLLGVVPFDVHVLTGSTPGGAGTHTQIHVDTHEPHEPTSKPAPPTDSRARPCQPRNARFTQTADTCHHSPDQARRWSTVPYRFKNTGGSRDTQDRQVPSPRCLFTGTVPCVSRVSVPCVSLCPGCPPGVFYYRVYCCSRKGFPSNWAGLGYWARSQWGGTRPQCVPPVRCFRTALRDKTLPHTRTAGGNDRTAVVSPAVRKSSAVRCRAVRLAQKPSPAPVTSKPLPKLSKKRRGRTCRRQN